MHNQPGGAPPVFVDRTGKRRRLTVIAGSLMGVGLLTSLMLIMAGLFGGSSVELPGWTDSNDPAPIEAGVDGLDEVGRPISPTPGPRPTPATGTATPLPGPTRSSGAPAVTTAPPTARPSTATTTPDQADERRTGKPTRSPGKPH